MAFLFVAALGYGLQNLLLVNLRRGSGDANQECGAHQLPCCRLSTTEIPSLFDDTRLTKFWTPDPLSTYLCLQVRVVVVACIWNADLVAVVGLSLYAVVFVIEFCRILYYDVFEYR